MRSPSILHALEWTKLTQPAPCVPPCRHVFGEVITIQDAFPTKPPCFLSQCASNGLDWLSTMQQYTVLAKSLLQMRVVYVDCGPLLIWQAKAEESL